MKIFLILFISVLLHACGRTGADAPTETANISIQGMTCENCVQGISSTLGRVEGVTEYSVDLESESAEILYQPSKITAAEIAERITRIGYTAAVVPVNGPQSPAEITTPDEP